MDSNPRYCPSSGISGPCSIRKAAQSEQIKSAKSIQPYLENVEFVIVPDITVGGTFDEALKNMVFVEHIASPLAAPLSSFSVDSRQEIVKCSNERLTGCNCRLTILFVILWSQ